MTEPRRSPTLRRRRLSAELRNHLEVSGLTAVQVDKQLGWTPGKFARMARGQWTRPSPRDISDLLDLFEVHDDRRREYMLTLARQGRERGWWHPYREMLLERYSTYIGLEAEASSVLTFETTIVPGLCQTPEYATALMQRGPAELSEEEIAKRVEVRTNRQKLLTAEADPLRLWVVLDEAVLYRLVGGPVVMAAQLRHLVALAQHPKVTVQIVTFGFGSHPGVSGPFTILEFPASEDPDAVYVENIAGELLIEEPKDVARHKVAFQRLHAFAQHPEDSLETIAKRAAKIAEQAATT